MRKSVPVCSVISGFGLFTSDYIVIAIAYAQGAYYRGKFQLHNAPYITYGIITADLAAASLMPVHTVSLHTWARDSSL